MERIVDYYPYDGSDAEQNKFYNDLLDIEKYIFNNLYPRTNGFVNLAVDGWGDVATGTDYSLTGGYGTPATNEYITLKGGPGTGISGSTLADLSPNAYSDKFQNSNIYNTSIYTAAGLPSDYGKGTRESNLQSNFDTGVTVEFWLKKDSWSDDKTRKEVVFDLWTSGSLSASADYGRITVELTGAVDASPFLLTAQSGSSGPFQQSIGQSLTTASLATWNHYAVTMHNTGSDFVTQLYVNGTLNDTNKVEGTTLSELKQKDLFGRIGALLTAPSGTAEAAGDLIPSQLDGAGKLSGSLDEFRFWKVTRNGQDVGRYWFTPINGGTNTDISNTTLGVYYKFNEGVTGKSATDRNVLDYSGRITNGVWTGYSSTSRATGSAILEAGAAAKEYKDPIIYSIHPAVSALKESLTATGSWYDSNNNSAFINYMPSWVIEEHENNNNNNLKFMSHIMGAYFDKLFLYTSQLPALRQLNYTSASHKPLPFAEHLPQSLGLYMPEIFVDSSVMEKFLSRTEKKLFENDLNDTKNLIYLNLYNNLANIYKAKGTEKSFKNVLRCFNVDERLVKINTYVHGQTFELKDNFEQILEKRPLLNLDKDQNRGGVVYQALDSSNSQSQGYISGTQGSQYEAEYGATIESDIVLPSFLQTYDYFNRNYTKVSLFGVHTVNTGSVASLSGTDTTYATGSDGNIDDPANFQVYAIKESDTSKNVYFMLTSSNSSSVSDVPIPTLTSSIFFGAYDDTQWNLSVRIKPSKYPLAVNVSGATDSTYDVIFQGINTNIGSIQKQFIVSSSVSQTVGLAFLSAAKRLYAGANRTNLTGTLNNKCDALFSGVRYWTKYLDDTSILEHAYDLDNHGISGSYQNVSPLDPDLGNLDVLNLNTLALNWEFDLVTGSDSSGNFVVGDLSSGSAQLRNNYGWIGQVAGYQHSGYGYGFQESASDVMTKKQINTYKFIEPERAVSSDAVQILSEDDKVFGVVQTVPGYVYTIEKSMQRAISEEMLNFFAGVVDFNNIIGEPVNRYRMRYKSLEKLREVFFRRVNSVSDVEKFIDYYRWFDDAISIVLAQLMPASSDFTGDVYNTIESHVLERSKYKTQYPTLEAKQSDPNGAVQGGFSLSYNYQQGSSTVPTSPRATNQHELFWRVRAERSSEEITSGDATVDAQRETFRRVINSAPQPDIPAPILSTEGENPYKTNFYPYRNFQKLMDMKFDSIEKSNRKIKGGVNFPAS